MATCIRGKGLSREEREDIFCEVRCEIYAKIEKFDGRGSLDGFIWRISRRKINKWLDKRLMERRKVDFCGDMSEWAENGDGDGEDVVELRLAIAMLPDIYKEVLLFYLEGYTLEEIAELTECALGTIRWRYVTAIRKLKAIIQGKETNFFEG